MDDLIKYRILTFIRELLFCAELVMEPIVGFSLTGGGKLKDSRRKKTATSLLMLQDVAQPSSLKLQIGCVAQG